MYMFISAFIFIYAYVSATARYKLFTMQSELINKYLPYRQFIPRKYFFMTFTCTGTDA